MTHDPAVKTFSKAEQQAVGNITCTASAVARIQTMIKERGHGLGIRLAVKKSGCNGFKYALDFADETLTSDHIFPVDDQLAVYIDDASFQIIKGTQIDYVKHGLNARFEFLNPNQKTACGCGESFGV